MKIVLINSTFWPVVGGAELIMRQLAELLTRNNHTVKVVTGIGKSSSHDYQLELLPELSPSYPKNLKTKRAVDQGQTDHHYSDFTTELLEALQPYYLWADIVLCHGNFTTHFNLALTEALRKLAKTRRTLVWVHDFTAKNMDYSLPNPTKHPWAMMHTKHEDVTYIAPSRFRQREIAETYHIPEKDIPVVPNGIDLHRVFGLTSEFSNWLSEQKFIERDLIFFLPARLLQRKNIDMTIIYLNAIKTELQINPMLIISGIPGQPGDNNESYVKYLEHLISDQFQLSGHVFILNQCLKTSEAIWQNCLQIADVIFFLSRYEAFGLPYYEAALRKIPCWAIENEAIAQELKANTLCLTNEGDAIAAAKKLLASSKHTLSKKIMRENNWDTIYHQSIEPLLKN
ncbi:MAG: glycosyltransferase family 4 protein [Verrucomicrobiota bacterium]